MNYSYGSGKPNHGKFNCKKTLSFVAGFPVYFFILTAWGQTNK